MDYPKSKFAFYSEHQVDSRTFNSSESEREHVTFQRKGKGRRTRKDVPRPRKLPFLLFDAACSRMLSLVIRGNSAPNQKPTCVG